MNNGPVPTNDSNLHELLNHWVHIGYESDNSKRQRSEKNEDDGM